MHRVSHTTFACEIGFTELNRDLKYLIIKQVKVWKKNSISTNYSKSLSP